MKAQAMPSKSDIQFGKIALKNHMAAKDEVEDCLRDQSRFERERHTTVLEAVFLARDILDVEKIEKIQNVMKRRVVFCAKCRAKYNVFQFRGGDKFLCNKCGNRILVPEQADYRRVLREQAGDVDKLLRGEPAAEAAPEAEVPHRETIVLTKQDIEAAKAGMKPAPSEEVLEPKPEPDADPDGDNVEEVELEAEVEEVPEAEPPPLPVPEEPEPATPAAEPAPQGEGGKKPLKKIKLKSGSPLKGKPGPGPAKPPSKEAGGEARRKVRIVKKGDKDKKR